MGSGSRGALHQLAPVADAAVSGTAGGNPLVCSNHTVPPVATAEWSARRTVRGELLKLLGQALNTSRRSEPT
jgi:hypothetical protein